MRVVLDTNVLVSALWWKGNERNVLLMTLYDDVDLVVSDALLSEFLNVVAKGKFAGFPHENVSELMEIILETAIYVESAVEVSEIKDDPSDDRILECAVAGKADYIVSGDRHLLKLKEYRGIPITNAKGFLKIARRH